MAMRPLGSSVKRTVSLPNREEVLRRNPGIDVSVVEAHERLERALKKIGVEIKPSSYNIEPPFGRGPTRLHNHRRALIRNS